MIVINYGVPKSASTYNWMLCRDVIVKDSAQRCYSLYNIADVLPDPPYPNFFDPGPFKMDVDIFFKKINEMVPPGDVLQIKVHHKCTDYINELIACSKAVAVVNFRHPAEVLLSLMDAYKKNPRQFPAGKSFNTALNAIQKFSETFSTWTSSSALFVFYDDFVLNPEVYIKKFSKLLGFNGDTHEIVAKYEENKSSIGQFNKGVLNRKESGLSQSQITQIEKSCPALMDFILKYRGARV